MTTETKICTKCSQAKPLSDFNRKSKHSDELNYMCRLCVAIEFKKYRDSRGDQYRQSTNEANKRINNKTLQKATNKGQRWTKAEDDFVREFWPTETSVNIAEALGRTYSAVNNRSFLLGLRKIHDSFLTETSLGE